MQVSRAGINEEGSRSASRRRLRASCWRLRARSRGPRPGSAMLRRSRRAVTFTAVAVPLLLSVIATSAHGNGHRPPRTILRSEPGISQRGYLLHYCWVPENRNVVGCADKSASFPSPVYVSVDIPISIIVNKKQRPDDVHLSGWAAAVNGEPQGPREAVPFRLTNRPARSWSLVFDAPAPCRHYYLRASISWEDPRAEVDARDSASWAFHVKTLGPQPAERLCEDSRIP